MDDVRRLLAVCENDRQRVLVALCGFCGLRVHEAVGARTDDIDGLTLYVRGKGAKDRRVPISEEAWKPIFDLCPLEGELILGYDERYARRIITSLGKKAKIARPIASHDLRATFATEAYNQCHDLLVVARLLGHSSIKTTQGYVGSTKQQLHAAVDFSEKGA